MGRISKSIVRMVVVMCFMSFFVLMGCSDKGELIEEEDGSQQAELFTCSDVQFSSTKGHPMDQIRFTTVPSGFTDILGLKVVSEADDALLFMPVIRDANGGGASFTVPLHPAARFDGGQVKVSLVDEEGLACDPVTFTIEAMPDSPGAFARLTQITGNTNREQARVFGYDLDALVPNADGSIDPFVHILKMADDLLHGTGHPESLANLLKENVPVADDPSDPWRLMDALVAQSGLITIMEHNMNRLENTETIPRENELVGLGKAKGLVTISSNNSPEACTGGNYHPSAEKLSLMMDEQIKAEIFNDDTGLLDKAGMAFGVAGVLGAFGGGGIGKALGAGTGGMGLLITAMKMSNSAVEGTFPSQMTSLEFQVSLSYIYEDEELLEDFWFDAQLMTRSKGWGADKEIVSFLLGALSGGASKKIIETGGMLEGLGDLSAFVYGMFSDMGTGQFYEGRDMQDNYVYYPPCNYGPTDITEEPWSEATIFDAANAPIFWIDRMNYGYRSTGEATIDVKPNGKKFGRRYLAPDGTLMGAEQKIEVKPIEVTINPSRWKGDPGTVAVFTATVANAYDTDVEWAIEPAGLHQIQSVKKNTDGTSEIRILTSKVDSHYPATIIATSTTKGGMRGWPNAPVREGYAILGGNKIEVEITPGSCCLDPGETKTFTATVRNADYDAVKWRASAGHITEDGMFTAPEEDGFVTITATSEADRAVEAAVQIQIGGCDCWTSWRIPHIDISGNNNLSRIEREGADGDGRLTAIRLNDSNTGHNLTIMLDDDGPLLGETGTYSVSVRGSRSGEESQYFFDNGTYWATEGPTSHSFYTQTDDRDKKFFELEVEAMVSIDEFIQTGSEPYEVSVRGTLSGDVAAWYYIKGEELIKVPYKLYEIGHIEAEFDLSYNLRLPSPAGIPLKHGSVFWEVCGMDPDNVPDVLMGR